MPKINGKCPKCKKETLETYQEKVILEGKEMAIWKLKCTSCNYKK